MSNAAVLWAPTAGAAVEPPPGPPTPGPGAIPEPRLVWIGSPHFSSGRGGATVIGIVVHTMAGTLAGSDSWFNNPSSQVSSHFGIGLDGRQHQYVALGNSSWANGRLEAGNVWPGPAGNPNMQTITIETEDRGSGATAVSDAQWQATLEVAALAVRTFPSIRFLVTHRAISPSSRPVCPGPRWVASGRFLALAERLGLQAVI